MSGPLDAVLIGPPPRLGPERRPAAWDEDRVRAAVTGGGLAADVLLGIALLWHDHLEAAHALAQAHEGGRDADWLHAIMHRREPDAGNSSYWFARVGDHPAYPQVAAAARAAGLDDLLGPGGNWRPEALIAACGRPAGRTAALEALQAAELAFLAAAVAG
jgi:hypothetical protein